MFVELYGLIHVRRRLADLETRPRHAFFRAIAMDDREILVADV